MLLLIPHLIFLATLVTLLGLGVPLRTSLFAAMVVFVIFLALFGLGVVLLGLRAFWGILAVSVLVLCSRRLTFVMAFPCHFVAILAFVFLFAVFTYHALRTLVFAVLALTTGDALIAVLARFGRIAFIVVFPLIAILIWFAFVFAILTLEAWGTFLGRFWFSILRFWSGNPVSTLIPILGQRLIAVFTRVSLQTSRWFERAGIFPECVVSRFHSIFADRSAVFRPVVKDFESSPDTICEFGDFGSIDTNFDCT